jgi:hypothetical protein
MLASLRSVSDNDALQATAGVVLAYVGLFVGQALVVAVGMCVFSVVGLFACVLMLPLLVLTLPVA